MPLLPHQCESRDSRLTCRGTIEPGFSLGSVAERVRTIRKQSLNSGGKPTTRATPD